jgi:glycosyltransferase involved in cell wall biosynthesis
MLRKLRRVLLVASIGLIGADRLDLFAGGGSFTLTPVLFLGSVLVLLTLLELFLGGGEKLSEAGRRQLRFVYPLAVFAAPAGYSVAYCIWYRNLYRRMVRSAEHILTVSNFSKGELERFCGADPARITVTYSSSDHFSRLQADATALERCGLCGKYVLAVSAQNPNKNFQRTAQAMAQLGRDGVQLVIAGGGDSRVYGRSAGLPVQVRALGYVNDAELKVLYQGASCFVFAPLYEGFGLPPLEALSVGCPVVVSRAASLPEIYEGAATFCDPYSPEDIAAAVRQVLDSPPDPERLKAFAAGFSWERTARETLDVLSCCAGRA